MWDEPEDYRLTETGSGISLIRKSRAITNARRHFHPWWELLYIASGERTFFYGSRTLHIEAGSFLCIAPGVLHRAVNPAGEVCRLYNLFFADSSEALPMNDSRLKPLLSLLEDCPPAVALSPALQEKLGALFSACGRELTQKDAGWESMAWALATEILVTIRRQKETAGLAIAPSPAMSPQVAAVIDWLHLHYSEEISLTQVAGQFGVSASHLSRSFRQATHFGFVEYVTNLRIARACRLLTSTNQAVLEIAMQCGFGSLTQFGRAFRALTGTNPQGYRGKKPAGA